MKEKYKWDKKLLKKLQNNPIASQELRQMFEKKSKQEPSSNKYTKIDLENDILYYADFITNNQYLYSYINDDATTLANVEYLDIYPITNISIQNESAMTICYNFFKNLDPELFELYKEEHHKRLDHLQYKKFDKNANYSGEAYFSPSTKEYFLEVNEDKNGLNKIITTIHEYAHIVAEKYTGANPMLIEGACHFSFIELQTSFIELLALDFIEKNYKYFTDEVRQKKKAKFNNMLSTFNALTHIMTYSDEINDYYNCNPNANPTDGVEIVSKKYGISTNDLKKIYSNFSDMDIRYLIGYLLGYELYLIHNNNPKKAIKLYKQLISYKGQTKQEIQNYIDSIGIEPAKNIDKIIKQLKR